MIVGKTLTLLLFSREAMANVRSFYGNKPRHVSRFTMLGNAIDFALSSGTDQPAIAIVGPPPGGDDSDNEIFDDEDMMGDDHQIVFVLV